MNESGLLAHWKLTEGHAKSFYPGRGWGEMEESGVVWVKDGGSGVLLRAKDDSRKKIPNARGAFLNGVPARPLPKPSSLKSPLENPCALSGRGTHTARRER